MRYSVLETCARRARFQILVAGRLILMPTEVNFLVNVQFGEPTKEVFYGFSDA